MMKNQIDLLDSAKFQLMVNPTFWRSFIDDRILMLNKMEEVAFDENTQEVFIKDAYPDITRKAFIVMLLIELDYWFSFFQEITKKFECQANPKKSHTGSSIDEFKDYIKNSRLKGTYQSDDFQIIKGLIALRNCIVHDNSTLSGLDEKHQKRAKRIRQLSQRIGGLDISENALEEGFITLTPESCIDCAEIVYGFMNKAHLAAVKEYA